MMSSNDTVDQLFSIVKDLPVVCYPSQVNGTDFSVCVVIAEGYENTSVNWRSSFPPVYMIDYVPLNVTDPERCNQHGRIALRSKAVLYAKHPLVASTTDASFGEPHTRLWHKDEHVV